ncbi:MAG: hypothetical protein ACKOEO_16690, partial [Planctomycetaceae bacterium]
MARLHRRSMIRGLAGVSLALPALEAMGREVSEQIPRRFCALYTANGMSLPADDNKIPEWLRGICSETSRPMASRAGRARLTPA